MRSNFIIFLIGIVIEDIDERRRQIEMQNEFERRAEERRQLVERHLAILNVPPSFDSINSSGSTTQLNDLRIVAERSTSRRNPPTPSLTTEAHNFYFNRYWHTQDLDTGSLYQSILHKFIFLNLNSIFDKMTDYQHMKKLWLQIRLYRDFKSRFCWLRENYRKIYLY